jgi:hypothetical protein
LRLMSRQGKRGESIQHHPSARLAM